MAESLAGHYARALVMAVFAPNSGISPQDAVAQLADAEQLVANSKPLEQALLSPAVARARKKIVVEKLAAELGLHRLIRNFLLSVISHRRIKDLKAIRRGFEEEVDERLGWLPAEVSSAKELSPPQKEEVERVLGTQLGKFIRANYTVDAALIGGVRARVASREYDASVQGRLEGMRQRLASIHH